MRLRRFYPSIFETEILDFDVFLIVKNENLILDNLVQVDEHRLLAVEFGEGGELVGGIGQDVDMLQHNLCNLVELLLPGRGVFLLKSDKALNLKLDRCERILDFVGDLSCHQAPCLVPFRLGKQPC